MTRIVVLMSAAALAGCGNVESNKPDEEPDGFAIELIPTTIFDERGDQIALSTGEPVHTHAGAAVTLGDADCPAVYKYSYLLGPVAPLYGKEVTPNPIAWKFRAIGGEVTEAEFRVRSVDATEIDWTPATAATDGTFSVEIHRSGRNGIPKLELEPQQFTIDFRLRDAQQAEVIESACWEHHPLAAPVSFTGLVANTDSDALLQFSVGANSPLSQLMGMESGVKVMQAHFTHHTAESVSIRIDTAKPVVSFTESIVADWFSQGDTVESVECETLCMPGNPYGCVPKPATDPRCAVSNTPEEPDPTVGGVLAQGRWSISVLDAQTQQPASECTVADTTIECALSPRMPGTLAKEILIVVRASQLSELDPDPTKSLWEYSYLDRGYTGHHITDYEPSYSCVDKRYTYPPNTGSIPYTCEKYRTYRKLVMIDQLRLAVTPLAMTVTTGTSQTALVAPHYLIGGEVNGSSFVWDSGNDDLPGPH